MPLNGLLDIELRVPDPASLAAFWERRGLRCTDDGVLGTDDRAVQLRIAEGDHRHLSELHLSCDKPVVAERPDAGVVGIGRHNLGSNVFWYLTDPAGNMFEFFADMDQIVDDEAWERDHCRRDWEGTDGPAGFSVWGPAEPPETFFAPPDLDAIAAARAERDLV